MINQNYAIEKNQMIVELSNISKVYGDLAPVTALSDVSIFIEKGSFVGITGHSGSGKTSLMNLIGLIDDPTTGSISIGQVAIESMTKLEKAKVRNQNIGFVFQSSYLLPEFTVKENILMPFWISKKEVSEQIIDWLDFILIKIGILNIIDKFPNEISGGQKQRVAIARALINKPQLILADEPTSNLDSNLSTELYELFKELNKDLGITIIVITHEDQYLLNFDRIITLKDGMIISDVEVGNL